MIMGNVSERRRQPPQVGVSVVILALGPAARADDRNDQTRGTLWMPLVRRVRQPFLGQWALPGGGLRADHSLEQSAYAALESTTSLHPRYLEQALYLRRSVQVPWGPSDGLHRLLGLGRWHG